MSSDFAFPAFESHGGRLEPFDDGHCPETFRCTQSSSSSDVIDSSANSSSSRDMPKIVKYKCPSISDADVHVYNDVLNAHHVQMLYEATANTKHNNSNVDLTTAHFNIVGENPWGTYVTVEEALDWIEWKERNDKYNIDTTTYEDYLIAWEETMIEFYNWKERHKNTSLADEKKDEQSCQMIVRCENVDMDRIRHALAVEAVAKFFVDTIPTSPGDFVKSSQQNETTIKKLYRKSDFLKQAHGVAVWALSSRPGATVQYHIDYAELLRYEYNVTVPPLWAGTIQCSPLYNDTKTTTNTEGTHMAKRMIGGEFCVNLRGLEHYAEHGYKGIISGDPMGGWKVPDTTASGIHMDCSNEWVTIPYARNQGIVHTGDLPHLSAPITSIDDNDISRVIVGFNVFGHDVGEKVAKAPEHSRQFRRQVKLYRTTLRASKGTESGGKGGMDLSQIRKNKGLTKLLVLAKRERVKEQLRHDQEQLSCNIWNHLLSLHASDETRHSRVGDIAEMFGIPSTVSGWPTPDDVHVHLNSMIKLRGGTYHDEDGVAGLCGTYYKIIIVDDLESYTQSGLISAATTIAITRCEN